MTTITHAPRFDLADALPRHVGGFVRIEGLIELDREIRELVKLRASQINGCAYCLDMHWRDARAAGMDEARLYLLDAWRESPVYTERERAALALCEAMTRLAPGGVPDEVWDDVAARFAEDELHQLVAAITMINTWNRLAIASRTAPTLG